MNPNRRWRVELGEGDEWLHWGRIEVWIDGLKWFGTESMAPYVGGADLMRKQYHPTPLPLMPATLIEVHADLSTSPIS